MKMHYNALHHMERTPNTFFENSLLTIGEVLKFTIIACLIVIPFRLFIAQPFIVSGASMVPAIHSKDYLVTDMVTYRLREPERGDVVVFRYPFDPSMYFVKRIIGLPGETVDIRDGMVIVRSTEGGETVLEEPYIADENKSHESTSSTLEEGEYFVLGDNRSGSSDSRVWGPLQEKFIVGRALVRLYPLQDIEILPGEFSFK
jgi:signal peptidase I